MKFIVDLLGFIVKIIPDLMDLFRKTDENKKKRREERKREREEEEFRKREEEERRKRIESERPSTMGDWFKDSD